MSELWKDHAEGRGTGALYYRGIGPEAGAGVESEQAYTYALDRCLKGTMEEQEEFQEMLVEWYYSGNWIKED